MDIANFACSQRRNSVFSILILLLIVTGFACGENGELNGDNGNGDNGNGEGEEGVQPGGVCLNNDECVEGALCIPLPGRTNFCMEKCDNLGWICAEGELCHPLSGADHGVCYLGGPDPEGSSCSSSQACAKGLTCVGSATEKYCRQACHLDDSVDSCSSEEACHPVGDSRGGFCRPAVGEMCATSANCADSLTCNPLFTNGYCTANCENDSECPGESICEPMVAGIQDMQHICLQTCNADSDCRYWSGYECVHAEDGQRKVCRH